MFPKIKETKTKTQTLVKYIHSERILNYPFIQRMLLGRCQLNIMMVSCSTSGDNISTVFIRETFELTNKTSAQTSKKKKEKRDGIRMPS